MMDLMSPDPQPAGPAPTPPETVVEFGTDPDAPRPRRRRWSVPELATSLAADRRAVPLAAAVGAVALFASLLSEWQITVMDTTPFGESRSSSRPLPSGIGDLGALGGGFLVGLFVLTGATVLGLASGGVLLAVLVALAASLDDTSRAVDTIFTLELDEGQLQLSYGRGLWCAFIGVAAVLLALHLAGRHTPAADEAVAEAGDGEQPAPDAEAPVVWSWRRPKAPADDERLPDAPFDLTVSPTTPFTSLSEDRDRPSAGDRRGRGISG